MESPCLGWSPNTALCPDWNSGGHSADTKAYALRTASYVLWASTGRRFGLCSTTVRPCRPASTPLYMTYPAWLAYDTAVPGGGLPFGYAVGACPCSPCGCSDNGIDLPGPVDSVTAITIDGAVLDPSAYRVTGWTLIRQDGQQWPLTQTLQTPAGSTGTWTVQYMRGEAVPDALNDAAGIYACEIAKARTGGPCSLPGRVQSISRQGVDIEYVDTADYLAKGLTGLAEVDQIIATINPYGLKSAPRVVSLDLPTYG